MSAIRVTATAAAVEVNQAMTQATEAPRPAMTVMQTALASQQAPAASTSADLSAGPATSQGSNTGTTPDVSGSAISAPLWGARLPAGAEVRRGHGGTSQRHRRIPQPGPQPPVRADPPLSQAFCGVGFPS
jgi:hypothetical protein